MDKEKFYFELRRGFNLEDHFTATFEEARQRGDRLASRLGNVRLYAYNNFIQRWVAYGTFLGHMRYISKWGDQFIIKDDFSGLVEVRKEASNDER